MALLSHTLCLSLIAQSVSALAILSRQTFSGNQYGKIPSVTVPSSCEDGMFPAVDEVIYDYPYSYWSVVSKISDFGDLTWSGNPRNTVQLNGSDNTIGTARRYSLGGIDVIETLTHYGNPLLGALSLPSFLSRHRTYREFHNTARIAFGDLVAYMPLDGERVTPLCDGRAARLNMTVQVCSNQPQVAAGLLHSLHYQDAATLGEMLGGENFTDCDSLPGSWFSWPFPLPFGPKGWGPKSGGGWPPVVAATES